MELKNDQVIFSNLESPCTKQSKISVVYTDTRIEEKIPEQLNISATIWKTAKAIALKGTIESVSSLARILDVSRKTVGRHCRELANLGLIETHENFDYKSSRQLGTRIKNIGIEFADAPKKHINVYRSSPDEQKQILNELFPEGSPGASLRGLCTDAQQTVVHTTTNKRNYLPKLNVRQDRQKTGPTPKRVVIKKRKDVSVLRNHLQKMLHKVTFQSIGGAIGVSKLIACLYDRYGWSVLAGYLMSFFRGSRKFPPGEFSWKDFFGKICSAIDENVSGFAQAGQEVIII